MKMFKVPYVRVNEVDEYFALPKKEREHYGLFRLPYGLPCDFFDDETKGWDAFYKEIKKQYPLQYFFRRWLLSCDNPLYNCFCRFIKWPLREFYYGTKTFCSPCFPRWRKTLPRYKYRDASNIFVESNFNILLDFYYEEASQGIVDWEADETHKVFYEKLKSNVKWIEEERKNLQEEMDTELTKASNNKKEKDYHKKYEAFHKLEKEMFDKESEIVKWMIDNREGLWT